jgi:DNA-binding cell septation regulator SpoVG
MEDVKPGAGNAGYRSIVISGWKPLTKGTLCGFFSATLHSSMVIHDMTLHEKNEARWVGMPAREWTDSKGGKQYAKLIEFANRRVADKFRDQILEALDAHLAVAK